MAQISSTDIDKIVSETEKAVRDGAYVVVGLGVLGFQRAQVRRRELLKRLQSERGTVGSQLGDLTTQLNDTASRIGEQLQSVDERVAPVREQLAELVRTVDERVAPVRGQLSELARTFDARVAPSRAQFDQQVDAIEERLPSSARNVLSSVRSAVAAPEAALRSAVGLD